jgi:hypothetical protein
MRNACSHAYSAAYIAHRVLALPWAHWFLRALPRLTRGETSGDQRRLARGFASGVTARCRLRSGEEKWSTAMRHRTLLPLSLALLLVALAATCLKYASTTGSGGAPPATPSLLVCSPMPTPEPLPPVPVILDHRVSSGGTRAVVARASGDAPLSSRCPTAIVVNASCATSAGGRSPLLNQRRPAEGDGTTQPPGRKGGK